MPHIDVLAEQKRLRRAYLKSLKVGSFIVCSPPQPLSPAERMAQLAAAKKREDERWFNLSLGPW
jgi:hypothetical protein